MRISSFGATLLQQYSARLTASTRMLSALRYPQYRRFWLGSLASVSANQMMWVAQGWLVYQLTGSPLYLGYAGLVSALPAIALSLVGGVLADKMEQRRLIIACEFSVALLLLLLAIITSLQIVLVWHVLAIAFLSGGIRAFNQPSRQAIFPHLVDRKDLMAAVSLNTFIWEGTRIIVPAAAGLIIAKFNIASVFYLATLGHLLLAVAVLGIRLPPIQRSRGKTMLQDMAEGVGFIKNNSIFALLIGISFVSSFFGMAYVYLLPIFAQDILKVGPSGYGFLSSVGGIGAVAGIAIAASLSDSRRQGWLLTGSATLFGASIILFALSRSYSLSLAALFIAGLFFSIFLVLTQTLLQMLVPDQLRGRVMGIYSMLWNVMPLGGMQVGAVANFVGAPIAVAIGGLAVAAYTLGIASSFPHFRKLGTTSPEPVHR